MERSMECSMEHSIGTFDETLDGTFDGTLDGTLDHLLVANFMDLCDLELVQPMLEVTDLHLGKFVET